MPSTERLDKSNRYFTICHFVCCTTQYFSTKTGAQTGARASHLIFGGEDHL